MEPFKAFWNDSDSKEKLNRTFLDLLCLRGVLGNQVRIVIKLRKKERLNIYIAYSYHKQVTALKS